MCKHLISLGDHAVRGASEARLIAVIRQFLEYLACSGSSLVARTPLHILRWGPVLDMITKPAAISADEEYTRKRAVPVRGSQQPLKTNNKRNAAVRQAHTHSIDRRHHLGWSPKDKTECSPHDSLRWMWRRITLEQTDQGPFLVDWLECMTGSTAKQIDLNSTRRLVVQACALPSCTPRISYHLLH